MRKGAYVQPRLPCNCIPTLSASCKTQKTATAITVTTHKKTEKAFSSGSLDRTRGAQPLPEKKKRVFF
ncbi:hypothetical protein E2542_SST28180 [Spatholobus suberectus]|nr:hypothetical protein E2542_SST28180 [Spatholobus suberectus]